MLPCNVRVHALSECCPRGDGRWGPMISVWTTQDDVYVGGSYALLLPDDFEGYIRRLRDIGTTVPPEYEQALQRAREREWG